MMTILLIQFLVKLEKSSVDAFEVEKTIDREGLWELQTPQILIQRY